MKNHATKKIVTQVKNSELVEQRHQQIVQAACKLFSQKGYHKTSLRDISSESGINLSYIYKYISTKDDILYLFYQYISKKITSFFEKKSRKDYKNPVEELKHFLKVLYKGIHSMEGESLTMYTESRHLEKDSLKAILALESQFVLIIEDMIKKGIEQGYFIVKDSFITANIIAYMLSMHPLRSWNYRDRYSENEFISSATEFILNALNVKEKYR